MNDAGTDYAAAIELGCEAWRRGDDSDGLRCFQQAALLWLDALLRREDNSLEAATGAVYERLASLIENMVERLETSDITAATDMLEYLILPALREGDFEPERS